ncbi:MAG: hypothetical protein GYB66_04380 [Chloroflexi bacterium]|nr:hypothetical protein [Chloroflexota bacterium]
MSDENESPKWLQEFEDLANERLEHGSACKQVHPIVEAWYERLMDGDPPSSRDSVLQAIACLATEIVSDMPDEIFDHFLVDEEADEESEGSEESEAELAYWVQEILMIGRAFQIALEKGELDDL